MAIDTNEIIVIPSIADPRTTVTSIAMFQSAFAISPPIPIVVIYGTCPNQFEARAENGEIDSEWTPRWEKEDLDKFKDRFEDIAKQHRIPVYFFDARTQYEVWAKTKAYADNASSSSLNGVDKEDLKRCVDSIFGATYSYGAQRNKAFMIANNLSAQHVFFFDDDTFLAPHVGNMIGRYRELLEEEDVYAVTGGYFGQRAFNASIFKTIRQQQQFMRLLDYVLPDDQATQDLWTWRFTDGVLGGNFCIKKQVYKRICCPSMHRTPTTDDKLIGREIREFFGSQVCKTGWPVVHTHFPDRMDTPQVKDYLQSWAKTKAFWAFYQIAQGNLSNGAEDPEKWEAARGEAKTQVRAFGEGLNLLAPKEIEETRGHVAEAIGEAASEILGRVDATAETVERDTHEFILLKRCWPALLSATTNMDVWMPKKNLFVPEDKPASGSGTVETSSGPVSKTTAQGKEILPPPGSKRRVSKKGKAQSKLRPGRA